MKRAEFERELKKAGWRFERHGGSHDIWTNATDQIAVPRHMEINEYTAKGILRLARGGRR